MLPVILGHFSIVFVGSVYLNHVNKQTYLINVCSKSIFFSDCVQIINISGKVMTDSTNTTSFSFMCSTTGNFMGCSVEFLLDKKTKENIKQVNDSCYHKHGICNANKCECSPYCKSFVWILNSKDGHD